MAQFHFVEEYEMLVAQLIEKYPIDEAMSLAVGGFNQKIGPIEADILRYAGLTDGMSLIDLGCGSGRLASILGQSMNVDYIGIDIVQSLLDYAKTRLPTITDSCCIGSSTFPHLTIKQTLSPTSAFLRIFCIPKPTFISKT